MLLLHASFSVLNPATRQPPCLRKMGIGLLNWIKGVVQLMQDLVPSRHWQEMLQSETQRARHWAMRDYPASLLMCNI